MLSVDPEDRFSNCTEAIGQLERALSGYVQDRARLFISYSHADRAVAKEFAKGLEETQRFVVWWDRTIVAGVDWSDQIEQGMENSDLMIVLLSRNSSISEEVKREWSYWIDSLERPIISLVIERCRIPYRLFSKQHLIMGQNASNDFVSVAAEIEILIPKVIVAFHDAARRSADLQRAAHNFHEPVEGSNERQFSPNTRGEVDTTAAQSTLDHQKDPDLFLGTQLPHDNHVGRESEFEPIRAPTIEAGAAITNAVGRRLIDLETMEVLEDRRKVEDFATVEIPESTEDSTPSPST